MEEDNINKLYKECLRNHAANLGSYATDGCGEFTLDNTSPSTLQCAACGCHRNFHRRVADNTAGCSRNLISRDIMTTTHPPETTTELEMIDYGGGGDAGGGRRLLEHSAGGSSGKKRFRTKFTVEQKEKMLAFGEKLGWSLQRKDEEDEVERFCRGVGVSRQVFKVWMHNHKNSSSSSSSFASTTGNASSLTTD